MLLLRLVSWWKRSLLDQKSYETSIGSMKHIRIVDVSAAKHDSSQEGRSVGPQEGDAVGQEAVPWGNQRRAFS